MPESMSYPDPNYLRPMPNFNKSLHVTRYPQLCNQMFASQLCRYLVSKGTMLHGKIRATRFRKHVIALSIRRSIDMLLCSSSVLHCSSTFFCLERWYFYELKLLPVSFIAGVLLSLLIEIGQNVQ